MLFLYLSYQVILSEMLNLLTLSLGALQVSLYKLVGVGKVKIEKGKVFV